MALEVDPHDRVPVVLAQVEDHPVPENPRIADKHVEAAEGFDGLLDQTLAADPVGHVVVVGDRRSAERGDLFYHLFSRPALLALPVPLRPEIIDDDRGAFGGQQHGLAPAHSPGRARDDRYFPVE